MKFSMRLDGGEQFARNLNALSVAVRRKTLHRILKLAGEPMRVRMGQLAPREPGAPDLADNMGLNAVTRIGSVAGGKWDARDEFQAAVAVGPTKDYFYGIYQEFGTVFHGAQPFGRPAFDATAPECLGIIGREIWSELRKANSWTRSATSLGSTESFSVAA